MSLITPVVWRHLQDGLRDPDRFWEEAAGHLPWFRKWDRVFEWNYPTFRWFIGGQTNLSYSAVDHHVEQGRGGQAALVYFNERGGREVLTYAQLLHQVKRIAAGLRGLGVGKGDRVTIYVAPSPDAIALMLACTRIGALHSVVFAGFGANALADRIQASGSKVVFTGDLTYRKGQAIALRPMLDAALAAVDCVERVVFIPRGPEPIDLQLPRDMLWETFLAGGAGHSDQFEPMESNEPAFLLATSGTTAKPKLAIHTHGGYQVHVASMARWCFGMKPSDVWWATSDIGWIVGHSYMVYGPLLVGCTSVVFEGALDFPAADTNWRTAVEEFGVTGIFTSPTAVRALMRYGDEPLRSIDHHRLERVVCAGEVLNPPAWSWLQHTIFQDRIPVLDNMWQTETAGPVFGNPYGLGLLPIKPGSAGVCLPGIEAAVVQMDGTPAAAGEKGVMVFKRPFPGMTPALWGEPERYGRDYWEKIPHLYYTGDAAYFDEDGYAWFLGRSDDIIKIAGHRIGTIEVESAVLRHSSVAECGVVGRPDETRGEVISAFVVVKQAVISSDDLRRAVTEVVRRELGPIAVIGELHFVTTLPKTRSGKIMRRVLRAVTLNLDPGDITTIEDEGSVEDARRAWRTLQDELEGSRRRS